MGESELISALKKRGEERIKSLWQEAQSEADRLRKEMNTRLNKVRSDIHRHLETQAKRRDDCVLAEARAEARRLSLEGERQLAERCLQVAREELNALADQNRELLLRKLAREIPEAPWHHVTVSPSDQETVRKCFVGLEITTDQQIGAGFVIATDGERTVIDNTLEMRLYRAWPQLLPQLLNELRRTMEAHEPAEGE